MGGGLLFQGALSLDLVGLLINPSDYRDFYPQALKRFQLFSETGGY